MKSLFYDIVVMGLNFVLWNGRFGGYFICFYCIVGYNVGLSC